MMREKKGGYLLKFQKEGLKEVHLLTEQINFNGTENYCNSIKLTMTDDIGNTYLNDVSVPVNNGSWSYNFIPDIEADANGKVFTIISLFQIIIPTTAEQ